MKATFKTMCGAVVLGMIAFNVMSVNSSAIGREVTLKNVAALQSSAGEMWCDQTNETVCTITNGTSTGTSKGFLRASW